MSGAESATVALGIRVLEAANVFSPTFQIFMAVRDDAWGNNNTVEPKLTWCGMFINECVDCDADVSPPDRGDKAIHPATDLLQNGPHIMKFTVTNLILTSYKADLSK